MKNDKDKILVEIKTSQKAVVKLLIGMLKSLGIGKRLGKTTGAVAGDEPGRSTKP